MAEIRGLGMWAAVDFGPPRESRRSPQTLRTIVMRARSLGVLVCQNGTAIELAPSLTITREELARDFRDSHTPCARCGVVLVASSLRAPTCRRATSRPGVGADSAAVDLRHPCR